MRAGVPQTPLPFPLAALVSPSTTLPTFSILLLPLLLYLLSLSLFSAPSSPSPHLFSLLLWGVRGFPYYIGWLAWADRSNFFSKKRINLRMLTKRIRLYFHVYGKSIRIYNVFYLCRYDIIWGIKVCKFRFDGSDMWIAKRFLALFRLTRFHESYLSDYSLELHCKLSQLIITDEPPYTCTLSACVSSHFFHSRTIFPSAHFLWFFSFSFQSLLLSQAPLQLIFLSRTLDFLPQSSVVTSYLSRHISFRRRSSE